MMTEGIPAEVSAVGLEGWFSEQNDPNKVKIKRYLQGIDTSSKQAFFVMLMERATEDANYKLSTAIGEYALSVCDDDYETFKVREAYIDGLFGADRTDDVKVQCCANLDLFASIKDRFLADNGGELPKLIRCRNRLIDVMVGTECDYDGANEVLEEFVSMGIMSEDELVFRKQSLKIHRLQKSFDNIFMYRPKEQ